MSKKLYILIIITLTIFNNSCQKPYLPPVVAANSNYLVVEGVINIAHDSTTIKLSRTVNIGGKVSANPELYATVTVESDQNDVYPVKEIGNGNYGSPAMNLNTTSRYHLHIVTSEGKIYLSDFEAAKPTPPIDSIGFTVQGNGIQLYTNTHDPKNNTRYYRWDYTETWNFHAKYETIYITDGKKLNNRTADQQIYTCFGNNISSTIVLGSSAKLSKDQIYQQPLIQIASTSEKLETKYSILVKQYALTSEAYNFWQNLKKNTEQLGSIFDAQPSELQGNIHCTSNPAEPVIGYISVTNIQQKRIFIRNDQLPSTWFPVYPYQCDLDSLLITRSPFQHDVAIYLIPLGSTEFAISPISTKFGDILGYLATDADCADCTIRGTTKQPIFWK
jgi:hypothetical protein